MAEHADRAQDPQQGEDATQAMPSAGSSYYPESSEQATAKQRRKPKRTPNIDWRGVRDQAVEFLAALVKWVGLLFAVVLVLHVVFVIGQANPDNGIVSFVQNWAEWVSLGFKDLFTPQDPNLRVLVNYGIAALFWLIVSALVSRLIRRLGGSS